MEYYELGGARKIVLANSLLKNAWVHCSPNDDDEKLTWIIRPGATALHLFEEAKLIATKRKYQNRPTLFVFHFLQISVARGMTTDEARNLKIQLYVFYVQDMESFHQFVVIPCDR